MRGAFIVLSATVCMVGLFIMAFGGKLGVRYFGSFLAIAGCQGEHTFDSARSPNFSANPLFRQPTSPLFSPTRPTTFSRTPSALSGRPLSSEWEELEESSLRSSVSSGLAFARSSGFVLTLLSPIDRQEDFPKYLPGLGATIGCQGAIMLIVAGLSLYFSRKNKKAEQGEAIEGNPNFRYTL